jgi:hypothetical protein
MSKPDCENVAFYARRFLSQSINFQYLHQDIAFHQTLVPHIKASQQYNIEMGINKVYDDVADTKFGLVYHETGCWKEAEEIQVRVMEKRKRLFGAEHPDTLASMGNLASTFQNQGQWKKAEELQVQVMETRKKVLGAEHPDTLTSTGSLASIYSNQGQWKKAEDLQVQVMETSLRLLGAEHPHTLTSISIFQPCINIQQPRTMEEGRRAASSDDGDKLEAAWGRTS